MEEKRIIQMINWKGGKVEVDDKQALSLYACTSVGVIWIQLKLLQYSLISHLSDSFFHLFLLKIYLLHIDKNDSLSFNVKLED